MKKLVTFASHRCVGVRRLGVAHGSTVRVSGIQAAGETPTGAPGDLCRTTDPETGSPAVGHNATTGSRIGRWYTDTGTSSTARRSRTG